MSNAEQEDLSRRQSRSVSLTRFLDGDVPVRTDVEEMKQYLQNVLGRFEDFRNRKLFGLVRDCERASDMSRRIGYLLKNTQYGPVSKQFCRMTEILCEFPAVINMDARIPLRTLFINEAPGGNVVAISRWRHGNTLDRWLAFTRRTDKDLESGRNVEYHESVRCDPSGTPLFGNVSSGRSREEMYDIINRYVHDHGPISLVVCDGWNSDSLKYPSQRELDMYKETKKYEIEIASWALRPGGSMVVRVTDVWEIGYVLFQLSKVFFQTFWYRPISAMSLGTDQFIVCIGKQQSIFELTGMDAILGLPTFLAHLTKVVTDHMFHRIQSLSMICESIGNLSNSSSRAARQEEYDLLKKSVCSVSPREWMDSYLVGMAPWRNHI